MLGWLLFFFAAFFVILIVSLLCLIKKTSVRIACIALFLFICIVIMTILLLGIQGDGVDLTIPLIIFIALSVVIFCTILLMSTAKRTPVRIVMIIFVLLIYFISCVFVCIYVSGKDSFGDALGGFSCERIGFDDVTFPQLVLPPGFGGTTESDDGTEEDTDQGNVSKQTPTPHPETVPYTFPPTDDGTGDDPCAGVTVYEFAFYNTKNELVRLSDYKGTPVCLWLWASWCSYSMDMLDDMSLLTSMCHADGYVVISAVMPGYHNEMDTDEWTAWHENNYERLVILFDEDKQLYQDFDAGVPSLIIFGKCGNMIDVVKGYQTLDEVEDLMQYYAENGY